MQEFIILFDACSPEFAGEISKPDAAGAAVAADHSAVGRYEAAEGACLQLVQQHINGDFADSLAVSLKCCQDRCVIMPFAHEFIADDGQRIWHGNAILCQCIEQAVCHVIVCADHRLRHFSCAVDVAFRKCFARWHPEIPEDHV